MPFEGTTEGDHHNCVCPHCGNNNHYVTKGHAVTDGTFKHFEKPCFHCKKVIYYSAQKVIVVKAAINRDLR